MVTLKYKQVDRDAMTKTIIDDSKSLYCSLCKMGCRFNCLSILKEEDYDEICEWVKHSVTGNCPKSMKEVVENLTFQNGNTMTTNEMW